MGDADQHPSLREQRSRARSRAAGPSQRAFQHRYARTVRSIAATAEMFAVTADHLSHEDAVAEVRAQRLRARAEAERQEARRLWDLADELEA